MYARAEGPALTGPWSPVKIADLLESVSPTLRDEVTAPLQRLTLDTTLAAGTVHTEDTAARFQLTGFASALQAASGSQADAGQITQAVESAIPALIAASTLEERRRAFEPVALAVAGQTVDRELLRATRSVWIDRQPPNAAPISDLKIDHPNQPSRESVELEVEFIALYW